MSENPTPTPPATLEPAEIQTGPLFPLGQVVMTVGICTSGLTGSKLASLTRRHLHGSWDMNADDIAANRAAMQSGARIFGGFDVPEVDGGRVWIITEAENDDGERQHTCILLPSEY